MCTILTVGRAEFQASQEAFINRILEDSMYNADGLGALIYEESGQFTVLRTFEVTYLLSLLQGSDTWIRVWIHQRMATQGLPTADNIHMWSVKGIYWAHNGMLNGPLARKLPVDSMAIGHWLKEGGIDRACKELWSQYYANVFMIDSRTRYYMVTRERGGTLYMDGDGNYSTNPVAGITQPVPNDYRQGWFFGPDAARRAAESRGEIVADPPAPPPPATDAGLDRPALPSVLTDPPQATSVSFALKGGSKWLGFLDDDLEYAVMEYADHHHRMEWEVRSDLLDGTLVYDPIARMITPEPSLLPTGADLMRMAAGKSRRRTRR